MYYTWNWDVFRANFKKKFNIPYAMANTKIHGYVLV